MTWKEYLELSEKTLSREFHCEDRDQRLLHAVIGILTEIDELLENHSPDTGDEINRSEELIDALWYCAIISREFNIDYPRLIAKEKQDPDVIINKSFKLTLKLLDMLKKKLYYGKPIEEVKFSTIFHLILLNFSDYAYQFNIDLESGFSTNIAKLKSRYGDKFTSDRAINRDLVTERNILQGQ